MTDSKTQALKAIAAMNTKTPGANAEQIAALCIAIARTELDEA